MVISKCTSIRSMNNRVLHSVVKGSVRVRGDRQNVSFDESTNNEDANYGLVQEKKCSVFSFVK